VIDATARCRSVSDAWPCAHALAMTRRRLRAYRRMIGCSAPSRRGARAPAWARQYTIDVSFIAGEITVAALIFAVGSHACATLVCGVVAGPPRRFWRRGWRQLQWMNYRRSRWRVFITSLIS